MTDSITAPTDISALTPAQASERLTNLTADKDWGAKVMAGDVETTKEMKALTARASEVAPLDAALAGQPAPVAMQALSAGDLTHGNILSAVADLRQLGLSDGVVKEVFNGKAETADIHKAAEQLRAKRNSDPEWVKRYLAGGLEERRESMLISIVLGHKTAE